jgi:Transposase, Mutator family
MSEDDREGVFHSQVFDRYTRYEPEVAEALTEMFGCWDKHAISVGEVAATLMGVAPSASTVSRLNHTFYPDLCDQVGPDEPAIRRDHTFFSGSSYQWM